MIQLDANCLILGSIPATPESLALRRWLTSGEETSTSAIAWMEFVTGPVAEKAIDAMRQMLEDRIMPVDRAEAELAAKLFNATGRKRALRYDCLIAAGAISVGARLATGNLDDFRLFIPFGLELMESEKTQ